jgi:hypothetical protein
VNSTRILTEKLLIVLLLQYLEVLDFLTPRIHFVNVLFQLRPNNVDIKATRAVNGLGAVFPKKGGDSVVVMAA